MSISYPNVIEKQGNVVTILANVFNVVNTLMINSTTMVANLNVERLGGNNAAFYTNATNITTGTVRVGVNAGSNAITTSGALSGGTLTATSATINGSMTVTGNLTIEGTTTTLNTDQLNVEDPMVVINSAGLNQPSGLFLVRPAGTGGNVVVAFQNDQLEMFRTNSTLSTSTPVTSTFANLNVKSLVTEANPPMGSLSLNLAGRTGTAGFRHFAGTEVGLDRTRISVSLTDAYNPIAYFTQPGLTEASQPSTGGEFRVKGTLVSEGLVVFDQPETGRSKGIFIRTGNRGQFTAAGNMHSISLKNSLLAMNTSLTDDAYNVYRNADNIMGTMMISVSNYGTTMAKNGFAMVSLVVSRTEMDVLPILVHKNALLTTFSIGKSSDNGNVVVVTDTGCRVAYQFYGAIATA